VSSRPEASESEGRLRLPCLNGSDCLRQASDASSAPGVVVLCPFAQVSPTAMDYYSELHGRVEISIEEFKLGEGKEEQLRTRHEED
jgi:hypothetical protein